MEVRWDETDRKYYIRTKIGNQTFEMGFVEYYATDFAEDFYVYLSVYNKRKHAGDNETQKKITGANPFETYHIAKKAFALLEEAVLYEWNDKYDVTIYCVWLETRRRDAYYKVLSKRGYRYDRYGNMKVIMRKWQKGEYFNNDF